ncbi:MAG: DUF1361 domain-containing protein [Anaerolineaceae bacterium]|nr:DUF1361 domain-containing protein [Anaerolineaceae bacterium]
MHPEGLRRVHRFLARHSLYPLLLASFLVVLLLAMRLVRSGERVFLGMPWNLFLAWIPYLASLWVLRLHRARPGRWWALLIPSGLWLAFFPNAPYLLTSFWHLHPRPFVPEWFDIGLLLLLAVTGLLLGILSLRAMQRVVEHYFGRLLGWLFVLVSLGLCGLGIYLGRFLRWNSWDLLLNPRGVLADVAVRLANPTDYAQTYGVTLLFAAILLVCYLTLTSREQA